MKDKYISIYGNAYNIASPHNRELMNLFVNRCKEHNIVYNPNECFDYMRTFEYKGVGEQLTLF